MNFNALYLDERELDEPAMREAVEQLDRLCARFSDMQLPLRVDHARHWEHARVLRAVRELAAGRRLRVLDVGGGNSPVAWSLVREGHRVAVLDVDGAVVDQVRRASRLLHWHGAMTADAPRGGAWPYGDGYFDVVVCVSVLEGVLRGQRAPFFAELRRSLRPGGTLLLTFDYGADARFVGDAPTSMREVREDVVAASGLELVGELPADPELGVRLPVRGRVRDADGGEREIAYTFCALQLRG